MKDILLLVAFLAVAAFGFFIIKRLDAFLEQNRKAIAKEERERKKPYVILCGEPSEDVVQKEIKKFRNGHSHTYIVVCDADKVDHIDL